MSPPLLGSGPHYFLPFTPNPISFRLVHCGQGGLAKTQIPSHHLTAYNSFMGTPAAFGPKSSLHPMASEAPAWEQPFFPSTASLYAPPLTLTSLLHSHGQPLIEAGGRGVMLGDQAFPALSLFMEGPHSLCTCGPTGHFPCFSRRRGSLLLSETSSGFFLLIILPTWSQASHIFLSPPPKCPWVTESRDYALYILIVLGPSRKFLAFRGCSVLNKYE